MKSQCTASPFVFRRVGVLDIEPLVSHGLKTLCRRIGNGSLRERREVGVFVYWLKRFAMVDYRPSVGIPFHRHEEGLASEVVISSVVEAEGEKGHPPLSVSILHEVAMTCSLYLSILCGQAAMGKDGVVRTAFIRSIDVTAACHGEAVGYLCTSF